MLVVRVLTAFVDRHNYSLQLRRAVRKSTFTVSALPDRIRLANLEASATFRTGCQIVTRSSWQLGETRRTADAMMNVNM